VSEEKLTIFMILIQWTCAKADKCVGDEQVVISAHVGWQLGIVPEERCTKLSFSPALVRALYTRDLQCLKLNGNQTENDRY
jgi:hypothetical protein